MTDCVLWPGYVMPNGYGQAYDPARYLAGERPQVYAHRLVYEQRVGPIPAGHEVHHRCGVKACVNPAHLEALTCSTHKRTHRGVCKNGHAIEGDNVSRWSARDGREHRQCRTCYNARMRAFRARRTGEAR